MAQRAHMRASDSDRDQIAERLRQATAEGRIAAHELEHRLAAALRARTYGELHQLVADLPGNRVAATGPRHTLRSLPMPAAAAAAIAVIVVAALAVAVIVSLAALWMVWIVIAWGMFGRRGRMPGARWASAGMCGRDRSLAHHADRRL